jgi:hypothetical protein
VWISNCTGLEPFLFTFGRQLRRNLNRQANRGICAEEGVFEGAAWPMALLCEVVGIVDVKSPLHSSTLGRANSQLA